MKLNYLNKNLSQNSLQTYCRGCILNYTLECGDIPTIICVKYGGFKHTSQNDIFTL